MTLTTRTLGRTGEEVTVLGFGAMELRGPEQGGRSLRDADLARFLHGILDAGINFIDTSIDYGQSEELLGRHLAGRRDEYFLASKCGCIYGAPSPAGGGPGPHVFTRENIIAGVEGSLGRLQTDHLDLVQIHASPPRAEVEAGGAVEALLELQAAGKVRYLGTSVTDRNIDEHLAMGCFDVFQIPYSALQRELEASITEVGASGAGTVIRGGVARGNPGEGWRASAEQWRPYEQARLVELHEGASAMEFMLRFTISHPALSTTIVGTLNAEHLAANVIASEKGPLPAEIYEEAKRRLDSVTSPDRS